MAFKITFLPFLLFMFFFSSRSKGNIGNNTKSSPFDFIKRLQGCHRGTKVQGLHELKLYLTRFGYLNFQHTLNHNNNEDDNFDEELEAALKSYQNFYHLNVTGTLDGPTVLQMSMPRCGQPDKKPHQYGSSLHTVSHFKFFLGRPVWPRGKTHLTYAFMASFPKKYVPPADRAFKKWASASGYFTFSKVDNNAKADLKLSFHKRDHGDGAPFDGPEGELAHAYAPTDGRLHYDAEESWSDGPASMTYDIETTSLHEIGHLLGLDHSQDKNAIMWSILPGDEFKGLNADDIKGVKTLYGIK